MTDSELHSRGDGENLGEVGVAEQVTSAGPPAAAGPPAGDFAELAQLRRIGALSQRLHRAVARAVHLNDTALDAMTILERDGALPPSDLAARLQITRGAVTGLIDRLEATGHAHREPDPVDGRSVRVVANPRSFEGVAGMLGPMFRDLVAVTSRYSPDERAAISAFLAEVEAAYVAQLRELGDDPAARGD